MRLTRRGFLGVSLFVNAPGAALALDRRVYIAENGVPTGPFDEADLRERITSRAEAAQTLVWHQGMTDWAMAAEVPALAAFVSGLPEETPVDHAAYVIGTWSTRDMTIPVKPKGYAGTLHLPASWTWTFAKDGTYTAFAYGEFLRATFVPGREPEAYVDESIRMTLSGSGNWSAKGAGTAGLDLNLEGTFEVTEADAETQKIENKTTLSIEILGPDRMRTARGETLQRRLY